ncbi:MAG: glutathione peroxidase [Propionibacteriales bacterium]|nr:glutathione peroxidase [Propionibacteriales bacterium]
MSLLDTRISRLDGHAATLGELTGGKVALVVNVASRCGLTPQYAALETVHEEYAHRGFTVVGVPSNQFGNQEPGSSTEIAEFCSTTYGVTFPMTEKIDVNGPSAHPVYAELTLTADDDGSAGDVQWNFEKFLLDTDGRVVARYRSGTLPDDPVITKQIESLLA